MGCNPTVLRSGLLGRRAARWFQAAHVHVERTHGPAGNGQRTHPDSGPDGIHRGSQAGLNCAIGVGWLPICRGPTFLHGGIMDGEARRALWGVHPIGSFRIFSWFRTSRAGLGASRPILLQFRGAAGPNRSSFLFTTCWLRQLSRWSNEVDPVQQLGQVQEASQPPTPAPCPQSLPPSLTHYRGENCRKLWQAIWGVHPMDSLSNCRIILGYTGLVALHCGKTCPGEPRRGRSDRLTQTRIGSSHRRPTALRTCLRHQIEGRVRHQRADGDTRRGKKPAVGEHLY